MSKTLSGPFVIPVQIDKFDPQAEIERQKRKSSAAAEVPSVVEIAQLAPDNAPTPAIEDVTWDNLF